MDVFRSFFSSIQELRPCHILKMSYVRKGGAKVAAVASSSGAKVAADEPSSGDKRRLGGARAVAKSKATSSTEHSETPEDEYRSYLLGLFARHKLTGVEIQKSAMFSSKAGARGSEDIAAAGKTGELGGNVRRDIQRSALRNNNMPDEYYAEILTHDPATGNNQVPKKLPFMLPHEMLFWLISIATKVSLAIACCLGALPTLAPIQEKIAKSNNFPSSW